ncbi:MAG: hypothetical protein U0931_26260 [Vulcanimicrobiota bacterium]
MEIPSWAGTVATVVGLSNPVTAPVVVGKWVADKANSALGEKVDPNVPHYNRNTSNQAAGDKRLVGSDGRWDGGAILNGQTQFSKDDPSNAKEQNHRCGPAAVLGSAVMGGKESTQNLVSNLQSHARPEDGPELNEIKQRIDRGEATHKDLSRLQHIMYNAYHDPKDQDPNMSPAALTKMQKELAGPGKVKDNDPANDYGQVGDPSFQRTSGDKTSVTESPDEMQGHISQLQKGQSFVSLVDSTSNGKGLDHFVTVGMDKDGRRYVYDPGGKDNQPQVVYEDQNPKAFQHYTNGSMGGLDNGRPAVVQVGGQVSN